MNFTYDILIYPKHLPAALQLVKQFPDQPFVIDHIAKPYIKDGLIDEWKKDMAAIAQYPKCSLQNQRDGNGGGHAQLEASRILHRILMQ